MITKFMLLHFEFYTNAWNEQPKYVVIVVDYKPNVVGV